MSELAQILAACARVAATGGRAALASVARRRGSLPMSATAKLLVLDDGATLGTIGGGCLEAEVIARAREVLQGHQPALSTHTLNTELAGDYGLTCGGTATILVEPVFAHPTIAACYADAVARLAAGEPGTMETALRWPDGPVKTLRAVAPGEGEQPILDDDRLRDPIRPAPRLVVFGGGHVGARIADLAAQSGWRVTLVDDRAAFADPARHPRCERLVTCDFSDIAALGIGAEDDVVVATRGHQHDVVLAGQLVPARPRYLGMLGSRRKGALTADVLARWGCTAEDIARIRCPVGLPIGADTPAEIAVSVVAELIQLRRGRSAPGNASRPATIHAP